MDSGARGSGMGSGIGRDRGPICLALALRSRVAFCISIFFRELTHAGDEQKCRNKTRGWDHVLDFA